MSEGFITKHPLITGFIILIIGFYAHQKGFEKAEIECEEFKAKLEHQYIKKIADLQKKLNEIQAVGAKKVEQIHKKAEQVINEIHKLPPSNCTKLTDDELHLWNALNKRDTS